MSGERSFWRFCCVRQFFNSFNYWHLKQILTWSEPVVVGFGSLMMLIKVKVQRSRVRIRSRYTSNMIENIFFLFVQLELYHHFVEMSTDGLWRLKKKTTRESSTWQMKIEKKGGSIVDDSRTSKRTRCYDFFLYLSRWKIVLYYLIKVAIINWKCVRWISWADLHSRFINFLIEKKKI